MSIKSKTNNKKNHFSFILYLQHLKPFIYSLANRYLMLLLLTVAIVLVVLTLAYENWEIHLCSSQLEQNPSRVQASVGQL